MARKPRSESASGLYHFITRGVNKKKLFHKDKDYEFYRTLLNEYCEKLGILIHHYCFMSNHTHLVVKADTLKALADFGHFTHRRYAYYYCKTYHWPGQVFRRNFLSIPMGEDAYLLECGRYIERNPLDANLVKLLEDYPHSSYFFYARGKKDSLITESPLYSSLGQNNQERMVAYRFYVNHERPQEIEKLTIPF